MTVARRCTVTGRVQGVFFRASTARKAAELGVTGAARNLPDGTVEVLACGSEQAVAGLCDWLHEGPPAARVDEVEVRDVPVPDPLPRNFATG
ncbi:acylphosphatase [Thioalkalivibrio sp. XN8]|uniref:acylphosphatase n=1 Tax=Thioalkalivibrio sp. XN8 TaxID=2712863 RepID=UPI0013EDE09B|nr:acylphosphatase [Thioalkalivibrio sp. XN8]